jgi:predicted GNAT family acetyltransferase
MEFKLSEGRIYSTEANNELIAEATYITKKNDELIVDHVYVNPNYRGQGIADKIMLVVVDYVREHNLKVSATCSYASAWFSKHEEEYSDILSNKLEEQIIACKIDGNH